MNNLLKNSLLQTNPHLNARVHAAVVTVAQQQSDADGQTGAFAQLVLRDLNRNWPDFILNAAADQHIQAAAVIIEDATGIVTTNVNDEQILNVINGIWSAVANKYAPTDNVMVTRYESLPTSISLPAAPDRGERVNRTPAPPVLLMMLLLT